ncbi:MAG: class IV adenylate cyclase [Bacteroidota bacterium]|nr:class IV adenylate cyclase [Bacteroidota bacterium]
MHLWNFEFKARAKNIESLEKKLLELNPEFMGEDHQVDTYFNIPSGRLKLREGRIENALIYYRRPDIPDIKQSEILLYKYDPDTSLLEILSAALGIKVVVDKLRRIYFIDNVKFHFDKVCDLGTFIEVEAINKTGKINLEMLKDQCIRYFSYFGLNDSDCIGKSYSDLILENLKR